MTNTHTMIMMWVSGELMTTLRITGHNRSIHGRLG
jgi:hypothetical protein